MLQQVGLGDPLGWFDWTAAGILAAAVAWQGYYHYHHELEEDNSQFPSSLSVSLSHVSVSLCLVMVHIPPFLAEKTFAERQAGEGTPLQSAAGDGEGAGGVSG